MEGSNDQDKDSKTLDPTEHAIQKALKKGRTPLSQELPYFALLIAILLNMYVMMPLFVPSMSRSLSAFMGSLQSVPLDEAAVRGLLGLLIKNVGVPLFIFLGVILFLIWGVGLTQSYKAISAKLITPKLSNLSLKKGLSKIFSVRAFLEFIKTLIKATCLISIVLLVTYFQDSPENLELMINKFLSFFG